MPSDTVLNFVNKVALTTGDFNKLTTVVGSPANIAERIVHFMNMTLRDLLRKVDFPIMHTSFSGTGDGVNAEFATSVVDARAFSDIIVTIDTYSIEEVGREKYLGMVASNSEPGLPKYFMRSVGTANELTVLIYPIPANGASITISTDAEPTLFTVADASTTEVAEDDLILIGTIAHMDAFSGMERGYMQLYESERNKFWTKANAGQQFRVEPEDYR